MKSSIRIQLLGLLATTPLWGISQAARASWVANGYYASSSTSVTRNKSRFSEHFGKTTGLGIEITSHVRPTIPVRVGVFGEYRSHFPSDYDKGTGITESNSGGIGGIMAIATKRYWDMVDPYASLGLGGGQYVYRASGASKPADGSSVAPDYSTRMTSFGYRMAFGIAVMAKPHILTSAGFDFGSEALTTPGTKGSLTTRTADGEETTVEFDGKDKQSIGISHFGYHLGVGVEF